ncbi:MAG: hypothetical protein ACI8S6_000072 [Myxococcota bacterium]|jgi:hypothetical protein
MSRDPAAREGLDPEVVAQSEAALDGLFGPGAGAAHSRFLEHLDSNTLQETLHRYHAMECDETHLSVEENYLIGMCVMCASRAFGPAAMFAKTLMHIGTPREKILEAVTRLSMWVGGVQAAEAAAHVQRAIRQYERTGLASMEAWFPPAEEAA